MTYSEKNTYVSLTDKILEILKENGYNISYISELEISDCLKSAKYYNKLNNLLVNDNDNLTNVCEFDCKCLIKNDLIYLQLKPNKLNTTKQMFIYMILKNQYATKQMFELFQRNELV